MVTELTKQSMQNLKNMLRLLETHTTDKEGITERLNTIINTTKRLSTSVDLPPNARRILVEVRMSADQCKIDVDNANWNTHKATIITKVTEISGLHNLIETAFA